MFIQTESTPNPNALKFFTGSDVAPSPMHFSSPEESHNIKLVLKLFKIEGVQAVFYGSDFITITKSEEQAWESIKPFIISDIMDHLTIGLHPMDGYKKESQEIDTSDLTDIEKQIIEIIDTRVRPSVAMDGGDITYKGFEEGIVYLELKGSCSGCPSSTVTLKNGIESMLQYYVPEVIAVEAVDGE
jgi:Fe-S cluster biogenesis protein NfuA